MMLFQKKILIFAHAMRCFSLFSLFLWLSVQLVGAAEVPAPRLKAQGDSLMQREQYSRALECYIQAMERAEKEGNKRLYVACIGNISNIYAISGEYERCEHYNRLGYEAALKQGEADLVGKFLINSVGIYCSMDRVDRAREQLRLMEQHPLKDSVMWRFYTIHYAGVVARLEKKYDEAIRLSQRALDYAQYHRMEPKYELVQFSEIGNLYLLQDEPARAMTYFRRHLAMTDSLDSSELQSSSCRLLAEAYEKAGHHDSAQFFKGMYHMLHDSVLDQRQLAAAKEKLYQYESRRTGQEISSLHKQLSRQWLLIAVIAGLLLSLLAFVFVWRKRQPATDEGSDDGADTRQPIYLNQEQVQELATRIDSVMQDITVISRPDFSLQTLATSVESNTKYVSYAINQVYGKTFKTLLNEQRVEEAARRLSDQEHYGNITIQGIYQELGYNSASAFIQAFKKIKGMTPSQFQREQSA